MNKHRWVLTAAALVATGVGCSGSTSAPTEPLPFSSYTLTRVGDAPVPTPTGTGSSFEVVRGRVTFSSTTATTGTARATLVTRNTATGAVDSTAFEGPFVRTGVNLLVNVDPPGSPAAFVFQDGGLTLVQTQWPCGAAAICAKTPAYTYRVPVID